jgi:raffinose/stachyose/melibiose transport system substrate-binding protein
MLAGLLLLVSAGFGVRNGAAQDTATLLVWDQFTGPESEIVDDIYAKFEEASGGAVEIERESYSVDQMRQTVNTAISSGTGPDIIFYDSGPGYAGVLANAGLLLPLDDMAAQYGWRDRIAAGSLEAATIDGQLYGLPLLVDLVGMYYNKTLLDELGLTPPATIDEMAALCQQAADEGYTPLAFANSEGWPAFHQFSMAVTNAIGPDALRSLLIDKQGSWNTPEIVGAISSFFVTLKDAGCYTEDANALTYDDGNSLFFAGDSLIHTTGSWLVNDIAENMPDAEVVFAPFPALTGGAGQFYPSGVGSSYYISASSEHPTEAGQFLDYLFSPDVAKRWVGEAKFNIPLQVDTTGLEILPLTQSILDVLTQAANGEVQLGYNIDVMTPPEFNETMLNGFQAIISGDKTPEELAAELQTVWEAYVQTLGQGTPAA